MYIGGGAVVLAMVGLYAWRVSVRPHVFELYAFDTPGAPAVFIRTEDDRRILVNGGANSDIVRRLTELLPFYSRRIDLIVATDDSPRNTTGLIEVLNRYQVLAAELGMPTSTDPTYAVFFSALSEHRIPAGALVNGDEIGSTPLRSFDLKKGLLLLTATDESALIMPFSLTSLTKKALAEANPDYVIYSAQVAKTGTKAAAVALKKERADLLAGILDDHRFNIRESGGVRVTIEKGRLEIRPLSE